MKRNNTNIIIAVMLIMLAAFSRIFNHYLHMPNIAPLAAISLFSGAMLKDKRTLAYMIPLAGTLLADIYFQLFTNTPGFYGISQVFTYGALIAATLLGLRMVQPKPGNALVYIFGASTLFFLISNFGVYAEGYYGYGIGGLATTYINGIPFFKYTISGDMAAGILLFGAYFLVQHFTAGKMQKAKI